MLNPLSGQSTTSTMVFNPQSFPTNRNYLLPTATIPLYNNNNNAPLSQPLLYSSPALFSQGFYQQQPRAQIFQPLGLPIIQQQPSPFSPFTSGIIQNPSFYYLTGQQQEQQKERDEFYKKLTTSDQSGKGQVIVPVSQQKQRDYASDTYFYDEIKNRSQNPFLSKIGRGPGTYSLDELQLIPLQRIGTTIVTSTPEIINTKTNPAIEGQFISSITTPSVTATTTSVTQEGSHGPMQWGYQDDARMRLNMDQDNYLAGLVLAYSLLLGMTPRTKEGMNIDLRNALRTFDVDEDTIATTETQLETLIYNLNDKQQNYVQPLLFTFPLHDRLMSIPLRMFIYGEIITDSKTGFKRAITTLPAFSWRNALPTGENRFRLRGENIDTNSDEFKLRVAYHGFLVKLYKMMWRTLMRSRSEQTTLYTAEYGKSVDGSLNALQPQSQSIATLEARIRAIAARFQLISGSFFNTAQFYQQSDQLKNIMHPVILKMIGKYLYLKPSTN